MDRSSLCVVAICVGADFSPPFSPASIAATEGALEYAATRSSAVATNPLSAPQTARARTLRVYDDVPSCGYLQPVAAHHLAQAPPDTITHYRATQGLLDAEAKTALRQFVGAKKNCEVGTRTARSGAVDGIKFSAPHQPRFAPKPFPAPTPTRRGQQAPRTIRG